MRALAAVSLLALVLGCQAPLGAAGEPCTRGGECATGTCEFGRCRVGCVINRDCGSAGSCLRGADGIGACSLGIDLGCESGVGRACAAGLVCVGDRCERGCTSAAECPSDGECRAASTGGAMFCFDPRTASDAGPTDAGADDAGAGDAGVRDAGVSDAGVGDAGSDAATGCAITSVCFQRMGAACALDCMGRAWCWGSQHGGTLGSGMTADGHVTTPTRVVDEGLHPLDGADSLACADGFACVHLGTGASRHPGHVLCWGYDASGAFADAPALSATDLAPPLVTDSAQVSASGAHACVLDRAAHTLGCFGRNDAMIDPTMPDGTLFATLRAPSATPSTVRQIEVAAYGACAILEGSGEVRCWGVNEYGEAGHHPIEAMAGVFDPNVGITTVETAPGVALAGATALAAGFEQRAVLVGTNLLTWGGNEANELGERPTWTGEACDDQSGLADQCRSFAVSPLSAPAFTAIASAGDSRNTCGVTQGEVLCWGNNLFAHGGRPGGGNDWIAEDLHVLVDGPMPQDVLRDVRPDGVFVGAANACAVRTDGTLWCWGPNQDAQLARAADAMEHLAVPIAFPFP